jgi:hypothetical protein
MPTNDALDPAQLPAGPALDAEIERLVFHGSVYRQDGYWRRTIPGGQYVGLEIIPLYSLLVESAWAVVERMRKHYVFELRAGSADHLYRARFYGSWAASVVEAIAETAPLAICRAALSAEAMAPEDDR